MSRWFILKLCFKIMYILINTESSNTKLPCPSPVLRKSVANTSCLVDRNYHCLEKYPTSEHQHGCRCPKRIAEGKYPIFDGASKYISIIDCPPDRFQPQPSFSYEINNCIYEKSLCTEEGQVIYSNGSTTEDRSCRCDYTKGYNFVIEPKERCYCIPSVEDCTCYKQQCPNKDQVLSSDYKCIINVNSAVFTCPKMESVNRQEDKHTKQATEVLSEIQGHRPGRNLSNLTAGMALMVLFILSLLFFVQRLVSDLEDVTCNEGEFRDINDAVILCTLQDESTANEFIRHVQQLEDEIQIKDLSLVLHIEVMEAGENFSLENFEGIFDTNRFIFLFVTQQFISSKTVSFIGDALQQESLMKQNKFLRVMPVSVDGPEYIPCSLQSLITINYYHYKQSKDQGKEDKVYVKMLASLFKMGRKLHLPI